VFGSSNAARILSEAARSGLGFTVGQRGLVGAFQALEAMLVLGRNRRFTGTALLCTGDRWIDIYPRILGEWAMLSDGAAAAAFTLDPAAEPNVWVVNDRVTSYPIGEEESGHAWSHRCARLRAELIERLSALVDLLADRVAAPIAIASPRICGGLGDDVEAALAARLGLSVAASSDCSHFGVANALINLHRAVRRPHVAGASEPGCYLVWDCDPSGLFGAVAVARNAFEPVTHSIQ
jgi:hypothetical protein